MRRSIHSLFVDRSPGPRARLSLALDLTFSKAPPPGEAEEMIALMDRLRPQGLSIQPRRTTRSWMGVHIEAALDLPDPPRLRIDAGRDGGLCAILDGAFTEMTPALAAHEAVLRRWWQDARDDLVVIWNDALPRADDPRRIDPETLPWKAP